MKSPLNSTPKQGQRGKKKKGQPEIIIEPDDKHAQIKMASQVSEVIYRRLFESAQDGIMLADAETGIIFEANPFIEELLGYSREEITGKKLWEINPFNNTLVSQRAFRELQKIRYIRYDDLSLETKDGRRCNVEFTSSVYPAGERKVIQCNIRDITERVQAEKAHDDSEKRYRELFEKAGLAIFQSTVDGKVISVNPKFASMFGYASPQEFLTTIKNAADIFADPKRRDEIVHLQAENPDPATFENIYLRKDGGTFLGKLTVRRVMDSDGNIAYFNGFIEDISDHRKMEEALRESENRYRMLAETAHDMIFIINRQGYLEYINKFGAQAVGHQPNEIIGKRSGEFFPIDVFQRQHNNLQKVFETSQPLNYEGLNVFPGKDIWLDTWLVPMRNETGEIRSVLGISRDTTQRKQAEAALQESEEKYRRFFEQSDDGIALIDEDGFFIEWNPAGEQITGLERKDVIGKTAWDIQFSLLPAARRTPEAREQIKASLLDVLRTGEANYLNRLVEYEYQRADGTTGTLQQLTFPIKTKRGFRLGSASRDITERKQIDEELKESEERYRLLFELSPDAIAVYRDGKVIFANSATQKLLGAKSPEEMIGKPILDFVHPDHRPMVIERIRQQSVEGKAVPVAEEKFVRLDGTTIDVDVMAKPIHYRDALASMVIIRDITERKQAEESLRLRMEQLVALNQASQAVATSLDLDRVLTEVMNLAGKVSATDYISIIMLDEAGNICRAIENLPGELSVDRRARKRGFTDWIIRSHQPVMVDEIGENGVVRPRIGERAPRAANPYLVAKGIKSFAGLPLVVEEHTVGVLYLHSLHPGTFHDQMPLLTTFANQVAIAIEKARLYNTVEKELAERKRAEEALRQNEAHFRALIENSTDAISLIDANGTVLYHSPSYTRLLGYLTEERLGKNTFELVHPRDREHLLNLLARILQKPGHIAIPPTRVRHANGLWLWIEGVAHNLLSEPSVEAIVVNFRDISERKQAEQDQQQSELQFRALFELSPDAVVLIDPNDPQVSWPIVDCNEATCLMNGYRRDELIGQSIDIVNISSGTQAERVNYMRQLKKEGNLKYETGHRHKNGTVFPVEVSTTLIKIGERELVIGIDRDISERRRAEDALSNSEAQLRALVEEIPAIIYTESADETGKTLYISPQIETITGYTPAEWMSSANFWDEIVHPEDLDYLNAEDERTNQTGEPFHLEYRILKRDGSVLWILDEAVLIHDKAGQALFWQGVMHDISDRKQAEEALQKSENAERQFQERLRTLLEVSNELSGIDSVDGLCQRAVELGRARLGFDRMGVWFHNPDSNVIGGTFGTDKAGNLCDERGIILTINDRQRQILTQTRPSTVRRDDADLFTGDGSIVGHGTVIQAAMLDGEQAIGFISVDNLLEHKPVTNHDCDLLNLYASTLGNLCSRKRAEEALRESEEHYRLLFELSPDAIAVHREGKIVYANPSTLKLLRATRPEEVIGKAVMDFVHPDYRAMVAERAREQIIERKMVPLAEEKFIRVDGTLVDVDVTAAPIYYRDEVSVMVIFRDITERKQVEEALSKSEAELRALFAAMPDVVLVLDKDGCYLKIAPTNPKLLYKPPDELLGKTVRDVFPKAEATEFIRQIQTALKKSKTIHMEYALPIREQTIWFSASISPMTEDTVVWVARDVTERKKLDDELRSTKILLEETMNQAPLPLVLVSMPDAVLRIVNPACRGFLGITDEQTYIGTRLLDLKPSWLDYDVNGQLTPSDALPLPRALRGEITNNEERRIVRKDGSTVWELVSATPILNDQGDIIASYLMLIDITERKRADELIRQSETELKKAQSFAHVGSWTWNIKENQLEWSDEMYHIFGVLKGEFTGSLEEVIAQAIHPDDRQKVDESNQSVIEKKMPIPLEYRVIWPDHSIHVVWAEAGELILDDAGTPAILKGIAQDITERKRAEEALANERNLLRSLIDNIPDYIYVKDTQARYLLANSSSAHRSGVSTQDDLLGKTDFDYFPQDLAARYFADDQNVLQSGHPLLQHEEPTLDNAGNPKWISTSKVPLRDGQGKIYGLVGVGRDISERKRADAELARQAEELRQRNEELARLYRASGSLISGASMNTQEQAQKIVEVVQQEFGQDNCSLFIARKDSNELVRLAATGAYADVLRNINLSLDGDGLVVRAILTGVTVNVPDVHKDPHYLSNWDAAQSELAIPLKVGDNVIGALDVQSTDLNAFSPDDERPMTIFAERAALVLEHSRLNTQTEARIQQLMALRTIDMAIGSSLDVNLTLGVLLDQATAQLGIHAADILIFNAATQTFKFSCERGFRVQTLQNTQLKYGSGYAWRAVRERKVINVPDINAGLDGLQRSPDLSAEQFVAYIGIPLIAKGAVKGILEIYHRETVRFDPEWYSFLELLAGQAAIAIDNAELFDNLQASNSELSMAYDSTLEGWASALELRDQDTGGHTRRTIELTIQLAQAMGLNDSDIVQLYRGALLHDIGKMGVPDSIVLKPGPLTEEEWASMRKHPLYAYEMLSPISYLRLALDIPYCHHEKWDGTGYPRGLKGEQIPLTARIFAVVDVWDALTSDRPYRKEWTEAQARQYIQEQAGAHFDPEVVKVFLTQIK